jgi:hypothetical protein
VDDLEDVPLTEAEPSTSRRLDLTSCDFVGDIGCSDPDCWKCHAPLKPMTANVFDSTVEKMKKKKKTPALPAYPKVIETYREPRWELDRLASSEPSAFNGIVQIRRYRVTAELIDEPIEVLRDRLRILWRESEPNTHHRGPMRTVAVQLGMDPAELLFDDQGIDYKGRL